MIRTVGVVMSGMWICWFAYWIISAFGVKRVQRRESGLSEAGYRIPLLLGIVVLLQGRRIGTGVWSERILPWSGPTAGLALVFVGSGLAFAVWARGHLAGNWSARVTVKEDHQLIRTGPYRWVRHPIYTGMLVALLGTMIEIGTPAAFIAFGLIVFSFVWKLALEERFMTATFGADYERYRQETARLIPLVW
jgi:protein-S-isoprenylcysteine O-methyltransferase Ste14